MSISNLYNTAYQEKINKQLKKINFFIFFFIALIFLYAAFSIVLSIVSNYHWLLYLNIPIGMISMTVIFVLFQVYLPAYKWEANLAKKTVNAPKRIVKGVITEINRLNGFYDGQHMICLTVETKEKNIQLYIRPWHCPTLFKKGYYAEFEVISKVIVSFESSDSL